LRQAQTSRLENEEKRGAREREVKKEGEREENFKASENTQRERETFR